MRKKSIIEQLAEFLSEIRLEALPEEVREKIHYCILDAVECCLDGNYGDPRSEAAWKYVKDREGESCAFGRGKRLRASEAAFYNAVIGAVSSRNDISKAGSCHAGAVVVPVVLALAESNGCSGKRIMEAVLAGYETMIRLGIAFRLSGAPKAFRSTAVLAPFGAAFAAAKVLGLDAGETANAASFACHSASGFNNWVSEGTGEDVFQNAWGVRNGIEAAFLARTGAAAAKRTLEDPDGFLAAFSAEEHQGLITKDLGSKWHILDVSFKPMSSCLKLQAPCQAAKKLLAEIPDVGEIQSIEVGVAFKTLHHAGTSETNVASQVQAIMSIPFGIANVLAFGDYRNIQWYPPYKEEIHSLMKLCTVKEQPALTSLFPGKRGAELTITMRDGGKRRLLQEDVEGLTNQETEERFLATMSEYYGKDQAYRLREAFLRLEKEGNERMVFKIMIDGKKKGENTYDSQK